MYDKAWYVGKIQEAFFFPFENTGEIRTTPTGIKVRVPKRRDIEQEKLGEELYRNYRYEITQIPYDRNRNIRVASKISLVFGQALEEIEEKYGESPLSHGWAFRTILGRMQFKEPRRKYNVSCSADGEFRGEIWLTPEQAKVVQYAADMNNWENRSGDWGGSFSLEPAN